MFNLLIVEDEEMIRNKILHCTDWRAHGFDAVFEADNGEAALQIVRNNRVDIVVTDIQMPRMSGIDLIKEIRSFDKRIKIVVISGHAEFEYAKESIRMNVVDYVLKPFQSKNLLEIVLRVKEELIRRQTEDEEIEQMRRQLKENRKALEEKFFADLLNNCFVGNIEKNLEYLGLTRLYGVSCSAAVLNIEGFAQMLSDGDEESKYLCNLSFYNWTSKQISGYREANALFREFTLDCYALNYRLDQLVLISFSPGDILVPILEDLIGRARKEIGLQLTAGFGNAYDDLRHLHVSMNEANSAARLSALHGKGLVFTYNDLCGFDNHEYSKCLMDIADSEIYANLKAGALDEVKREIFDIIVQIKESKFSQKAVESIVSNIVFMSCKTINEMGYDLPEIFGREGVPTLSWDEIGNRIQLEEWLLTFFTKIHDYIRKRQCSRNRRLIMDIKEYIDEHYAENINLSFFAKKLSISSGYLSVLINDHLGMNFIDYLTHQRIQKAKELLRNTDLRIYEIAERVGYRDAFYFSGAFKKTVGVNPTEYREGVGEFNL